MKIKLLLISFILLSVQAFAQYPEIKISEIQYIHPDTLEKYKDYKSEFENDTVTIVGVVMTSPYKDADPNSTKWIVDQNTYSTLYLQDTSETDFAGMYVRFNNATTAFKSLDSGMVIKVTGKVSEYFTTTQFNAIDFQFEDVLGNQKRPDPVVLTLDSLVHTGTFDPKYSGEKWEHVLVEIRDVTVTDQGSLGAGSYSIFDKNGSTIIVGNKSTYFRNTAPVPLPNTKLKYVRGYIENRNNINTGGWFIINPIYPEDVKYGDVIPPTISNFSRDKATVKFGEEVKISAKVKDDVKVDSVKLFYSVNGGNYEAVKMEIPTGDSVYSATIPALNDSSLVTYFVEATDNQKAKTLNPTDTLKNRYFYLVMDRDIKIQDVQYSPFGGGYSAYNNQTISVRGIVTADTSDIPGSVYIQNGNGPWSGIWVRGTEAVKLQRGDDVTITAIVNENYNVTNLNKVDKEDQIVVHSQNNDLPEPSVLSTSEIGTSGNNEVAKEMYEGVLIKFENVIVIDENADGDAGPHVSSINNNHGEIFIADTSNMQTRVELQDGNHGYHNFWASEFETLPVRLLEGDKFESLTGILYFSFGNYKLIPRKNSDFVGYVTGVNESKNAQPLTYSLEQNYPNPFNPSTTIEYVIPENGFVTVKIYNVLGKEVAALVDQHQTAGRHKVSFNASNLSSGVYFYKIDAGKFTSVKKMMLVK